MSHFDNLANRLMNLSLTLLGACIMLCILIYWSIATGSLPAEQLLNWTACAIGLTLITTVLMYCASIAESAARYLATYFHYTGEKQ